MPIHVMTPEEYRCSSCWRRIPPPKNWLGKFKKIPVIMTRIPGNPSAEVPGLGDIVGHAVVYGEPLMIWEHVFSDEYSCSLRSRREYRLPINSEERESPSWLCCGCESKHRCWPEVDFERFDKEAREARLKA